MKCKGGIGRCRCVGAVTPLLNESLGRDFCSSAQLKHSVFPQQNGVCHPAESFTALQTGRGILAPKLSRFYSPVLWCKCSSWLNVLRGEVRLKSPNSGSQNHRPAKLQVLRTPSALEGAANVEVV